MRLALFAATILQSVSLFAQPSVGTQIDAVPSGGAITQPILSEEVTSTPFAFHRAATPFASPAVAMAKDRTGIAIAWSMPNGDGLERIYVSRLDATAHVSGQVREVPIVSGDNTDAFGPSIAASADGNGFVIGWLQALHGAAKATAAYARLDHELSPASPAIIAEGLQSALIIRTGLDTWLTAGGGLWRMKGDASAAEPQRLASIPIADDMVVTADHVRTVGLQPVQPNTLIGCACPTRWGIYICPAACQILGPTGYYPAFMQLNDPATPLTVPFPTNVLLRNIVLQDDGRILILAWFDGKLGEAGEVRMARILEPQPIWPFSISVSSSSVVGEYGAADAAPTAPAIATDGQRFVIVWRTRIGPANHDIRGALVDENGTVTPVDIADSSADEIDPSVIATRPGEFLIAYEKYSGGERRIAGKLLTFPSRRRAVR